MSAKVAMGPMMNSAFSPGLIRVRPANTAHTSTNIPATSGPGRSEWTARTSPTSSR